MLKHKKIIIVLLLAYLIRMIALNQSLWLDEAVTAKVVLHYDYSQIISKFSPTDFHPPLYYLFMKAWSSVFGYSEVALRMPSVIFSILTGWIIYLMAGFWPMVFFLFNPLVIYYSQEARQYMLTVFFLTLSIYWLIKILQNQISNIKYQNLILFIFTCVLSFYTFYGSIFLIAAFFLYWLYKKEFKIFLYSWIPFVLLVTPLAPLIYKQLLNSKLMLQSVANWSLVLGKANLKDLLLIPMKFAFGRISFYPKIVYYLLSGIWTLVIFYFVIKGGVKKKFWLYLFTIPLLLGFVFSFFSPMLQYFRFIYLIPFLSILIDHGVKKNWQKFLVTTGFVVLSLVYLLLPQFHREDWRSLAYYLPAGKQVYMILPSSDGLTYYRPDIKIKDLRDSNRIYEKEIVVVPYTAEIYGLDYKKTLEERGYQLKEKRIFRELYFEVWTTSFYSRIF